MRTLWVSGTSELARVVNSIWYPLWTFGVSATSELARVVNSTWYPLWTFGESAYATCDLMLVHVLAKLTNFTRFPFMSR